MSEFARVPDVAKQRAIELEQALLGAIINRGSPAFAAAAAAGLTGGDFFHIDHAEVWGVFESVVDIGERPNGTAAFRRLKDLAGARLCRYWTDLSSAHVAVTVRDVPYLAGDIIDERRRRAALIEAATLMAEMEAADLGTPGKRAGAPAKATIERHILRLQDVIARDTSGSSRGLADVVSDVVNQADLAGKGEAPPPGLPTGFEAIDELLSGMERGGMYVIGARPSMGKAQPLDAKILMADGAFREMGSLRLGDCLASVDGAPSRVAGIYPQGEREVFRVTFSDGRTTEACAEHLWRVGNRKWTGDQVISTRDLIELLRKPSYVDRVYIPTVSGHFGHDRDLPVDPWLLGALVGNGGLARLTPLFSTADAPTLWLMQEKVAAAGGVVTRSPGSHYDFRIKGFHQRNDITLALRAMGLMGKRSHEKFLPPEYLTASHRSRVELLRGLMDTDGYVEKDGAVRYSTSSEQLAHDVRDIVRSLGGNCEIASKTPHFTYLGERREGRRHFVCKIRFSHPRDFIGLIRKQRRAPDLNDVRLNITSIESVGVKPVQCVAVTHASHLYVTDNYIVTHNTALATGIALNVAREGKRVGFFSLEMTRSEMALRLLSLETRLPMHAIRRGRLSAEDWAERIHPAEQLIRRLKIDVDDRPGLRMAEIEATARTLGPDLGLVIIDHIGLVGAPEDARGVGLVEKTAAVSNGCKRLAKALQVPVLALCQLSRANEQRDDKRPQLSDLRWSGEIEQDADAVIFLHRQEYYVKQRDGSDEELAEVAGKAEAIIAKNRNGSTGSAQLRFESRAARFCSITERMP